MSVHTSRFGGNLSDIPLPHRRYFDDKRRKREVRIILQTYFGIGTHYYIDLREEENPVWNPIDKVWQESWHDKDAKGLTFMGRFDTKQKAINWAYKMIQKHFPKHRVVGWGQSIKWFYRESD